jgi:hypothetical protein
VLCTPAIEPDLDESTLALASHDDEPDEKPTSAWGRCLASALADVEARLNAQVAGSRAPLFDLDAVELLAQVFDGARWLVTGLVTRGAVGVLGGEPKTVKTWAATELALANATGTSAFGEFFAQEGRVAYFYAEDLDVQARNRIRALCAGAGRTLPRGRLYLRPRGTFLDVTRNEDLAWLVGSCRRIGQLELLVLDPLRDIHSGEEDKSDSMRNVMRRLRVLAELLGCAVLVVHHAPKATKDTSTRRAGQNLRGSGAIHGAIDAGLYFTDTTDDGSNVFRNVVTSQIKGARSAGRFELELTVEDDANGEAVKATWSVSREKPGQAKQTAKQKAVEADDAAALAFVRGLAMRGERLSRRALRDHDERPLPEKRLRDALDRLIDVGQLVLIGSLVSIPELKQGREP